MLGPILSAVPGIAMAFLDSPQKALLVALVYWAVQFLEGHILAPLLMKKGVDLPPVVTLIGLSLMAIVFGFLGMMVAVPVLAAVMVAIKMLYVEDVVGDDIEIGDAPDAPVPAHPAGASDRVSPRNRLRCVSNRSGCLSNRPDCSSNRPGCLSNAPGCSSNRHGCSSNCSGCLNNRPGCVRNRPECVRNGSPCWRKPGSTTLDLPKAS